MKKIYALVLKTYLGPLLVTFFISLFILLMQFMWMYIDDLVGKGLEWYIIGELLFYASFTFVPLNVSRRFSLSGSVMFRRRTATVISSLPLAKVAAFVVSKSLYLFSEGGKNSSLGSCRGS